MGVMRSAAVACVLVGFVTTAAVAADPVDAAPVAVAQGPGGPALMAGAAAVDITPPPGYPLSGYYHERLATGTKDPLFAKALVLRQGDTAAAIVVCDLIVIATDLTVEVRRRVAERTGIPAAHVTLAATHTHTGPDYTAELFALVTGRPRPATDTPRPAYVPALVDGIVTAVVRAEAAAEPVTVASGRALQQTPVSFNRRFLMRDGSVRTWMNLANPDVLHAAGPVDPEIGIVRFDAASGPRALLHSFALHLDTVHGSEYSADFPHFIAAAVAGCLGEGVVSLFGNGCCGNINHVDPAAPEPAGTAFIGGELGRTLCAALPGLVPVAEPTLQVRRATVRVPLLDSTPAELAAAKTLLRGIRAGARPPFLDHVDAYRRVVLDGLRHGIDRDEGLIGWGLTQALAGCGETMPLDVQVITLGREVAVVAFPGEAFVEFGLAIKNASPFATTLVVELANHGETIYVPTRTAAVGGGYETVNTTLAPGAGELLAETAVRLLIDAAGGLPRDPRPGDAR